MSSDDIANLYRQFGGTASDYQELGRDNVMRQSRERWPLLANVRQQDAARAAARPVSAGEHTEPAPAGMPVAPVFDEATAAAAAEAARNRPLVARPRTPLVAEPLTAALPELPPSPTALPVEPVLSPEPLAPRAPVSGAALPPFARAPSPATFAPTTSAAPAPAGTELQGLFSRLARPPEPPAPPADRETSLLRRLLRS